jgi:hypothetical protein
MEPVWQTAQHVSAKAFEPAVPGEIVKLPCHVHFAFSHCKHRASIETRFFFQQTML